MTRGTKEKQEKNPSAIYQYSTVISTTKKYFLEESIQNEHDVLSFFYDKGYVLAPLKGKSSVSSQLFRWSIKTMCYNCNKKKHI